MIEPIYYDVLFKENTAIYGNNIASLPLRMKIKIYDNSEKNYINLNSNAILELKNLKSGELLKYKIEIEFVDFNDVIVSSLNFFE